jgi:hypothetical protein
LTMVFYHKIHITLSQLNDVFISALVIAQSLRKWLTVGLSNFSCSLISEIRTRPWIDYFLCQSSPSAFFNFPSIR